jgi:di/tricarboxylate transporter
VKRLLLSLESAAAAAALVPVAVVFGLGIVAWGIARDLQRTEFGRVAAVRSLLVWLSGDALAESEERNG